jgi:hypothetical protein
VSPETRAVFGVTLSASAAGKGGFGLAGALGIPAAVVAALTLLSYLVGLIRPIAIRKPRYWTTGSGADRRTDLTVGVKNRKYRTDRQLSKFAVVHVPRLRKRLRHPRWRKNYVDQQPYLPWGDLIAEIGAGKVTVEKRNEHVINCELRTPAGEALPLDERLSPDVRVMAWLGTSRPAMKKPRYKRL